MMTRTNIFSRIKAAVIGAAMIATTFITPAMSSVVTAADAATEVKAGALPYTLIADGVDNGKRQANFNLSADQKNAKSFTIKGTAAVSGNVACYGFGTTEAPDYWTQVDEAVDVEKGDFSFNVDVPAAAQGKITKIGIGIWYPKDNSEFVIKSIEASGSSGPVEPVGPNIPTSENDKSGTYTFTPNADGKTATITATLSAQYDFNFDKDPDTEPVTQSDILLTQGVDEEDYAPYLDADGNMLPEKGENDPINSYKFRFENFGIDDMSNIKFQSFEYVLKSDDYDMSTVQYGGGINVQPQSDADTEFVKGKNGFWYNDQGEEDMEKYGSKFKIDDIHGAYKADGLGGYAKITWDVPKGVQPYVTNNPESTVGFQYWWGKDDTKTGTDSNGEEQNYAEIPELHLVSCTATYTRTMVVPYNKTIDGPKNIKLTTGSDETNQERLSITDLKLGERDKVSAILFHFKSAAELTQFVGGAGISVDEAKAGSSADGVKDGWYQTGNIAVINTNGEFDVMWILPEIIGRSVFKGDENTPGEALIGYWYGDKDGEAVKDITIDSVKYYIYESTEENLDIKGEDGLELPDQLKLKVGDTYELDVNIPGATFESERPNVVSVDENGKLEALLEGMSVITVTTPEGQEAKITVVVEAATTTSATSATTKTTTKSTTVSTSVSTSASTTVDPNTVIDWSRVLYGDANVDGKVGAADVAAVVKYLLSSSDYPLTATGLENANVADYDEHDVNQADISWLSSYVLTNITLMDLGPEDKSSLVMYKNLKLN